MKNKIRIGIIGTGFARQVQIPSFLAAGAEVVSVASGSLANAESTAKDFNIGHFTGDWRETVERDDVDLISIVTPPVFHREMTLAALENGKHVLCEKPMAMNAAEAEEMTERAGEKGVLALINHELRFLNGRRKAFSMIRNGEIGKITHVKNIFRNANYRLSLTDTNNPVWSWWSDADKGGGALGANASHVIDSYRWLLGTEVSEVFCLLKANVKKRLDEATNEWRRVTADDEANLILRFAESDLTEDASGTISSSVAEFGGYENRLEIYGLQGAITVQESGELWLAKMSDNDWQKVEFELGETAPNVKVGGWTRGFLAFAKEIVAALQAGKIEIPHAATFADGLKTQIVLDAARKSTETRCSIKIE